MLSRIDRMKMLPEFQYKEQLNIFMRILYWLRELLGSIDFQAIELQGASLSAVLGIVLFNPFVDTFSTGRGYAAMAGLFSEYTWGAILFTNGALALIAMARRSYHWRRAMMFAIACQWGFIGTTFYLSNPYSWSPYFFVWLMLSAGWAYWRMSLRRA
jgi:glycerol-3-phosphate acyltransferase PlsY